MPVAKDPIRRQLVQARRAQIIDAAARVFAEKGFHRATTREIASAAGVSEGTIYNYFDSKADLLIGIMACLAELEQLDVELTQALQGDVKDFMIAISRHRLACVQRDQELLQAVLPEVLVDPELRQRFYRQYVLRIATLMEQYVQARIELGHMRPVDAPLAVRVVQGAFIGLLILWILGDEPLQSRWDDVPEVLAALVFDGLGAARVDER